jgi:hypothetical protein
MSKAWEDILAAVETARMNGLEFILVFLNTENWEPEIRLAKDVEEFWQIYQDAKRMPHLHLEYSFTAHTPDSEIGPLLTRKIVPQQPIYRSEVSISTFTRPGDYVISYKFTQHGEPIGEMEVAEEMVMQLIGNHGRSSLGDYFLNIWAKQNNVRIIEDRQYQPEWNPVPGFPHPFKI